ncbi:MAG: ion transporter [Oscillospiraceae bacterium]|nr:ion transporter [Oscillospiraceae bacterium]
MRKRIFEVIEVAKEGDILSAVYDSFMMLIITLSLLPLVFKESTPFLTVLDKTTAGVFIVDYLLRWSTADLKFHNRSVNSFLRYPFSFMAIVDLLSILPSLTFLNSGFKVLRLLRMSRAFRVLRVFRALRYSRSLRIIGNVLRSSKDSLAAVGTLAIGYIFISSLIIFNAEPDSFNNFFEAMYWATVSLTTVGYGDIYPVSTLGRAIAMVSSIFGMAIVALPSGIITAGYMRELEKERRSEREKLDGQQTNL